MKVNITLDDSLMERIDQFADSKYMTRSGFVSLACSTYLQSQECMDAVKRMSFAMQRIAENNEIDEATQKELEDFTRLANLIVGRR